MNLVLLELTGVFYLVLEDDEKASKYDLMWRLNLLVEAAGT
jgi:hypothetical protein